MILTLAIFNSQKNAFSFISHIIITKSFLISRKTCCAFFHDSTQFRKYRAQKPFFLPKSWFYSLQWKQWEMLFNSPLNFFLFLRYFNFCPDLFGHVGKRIDKKGKFSFSIYDVIYWETKIEIKTLPNISRS